MNTHFFKPYKSKKCRENQGRGQPGHREAWMSSLGSFPCNTDIKTFIFLL